MTSFAAFAGRITRGYVTLACALILLVVVVSSLLAFALYAGTLSESVETAAQRAGTLADQERAARRSVAQTASDVETSLGKGRVSILVFDDSRRLLAGKPQPHLFGFRRQLVHFPGGTIVVEPDLSRFLSLLAWYWSIVLPVGVLAVLVAWLAGRNLTRRALAPLENVTQSLRGIAGGDFQPQPLAAGGGDELAALTTAYNDVAHRLTAATAQHREDEARMRQFIADAGHELRTPLTVIMGYLDMLSRGAVRDDESVTKIHETMHAESQRMRAVIEKLLLLARLDRPFSQPPRRIDAGAIAQRAAAELEPLAGDRISVRTSGDAAVDADESDLYEAIKNVIDNAVRYAAPSPVDVVVSSDGSTVVVTVRDRGPGIDAADMPHVFERFYRGRSRSAPEGSGLGLAIARKAVERAGGSVALENAQGGGTLVTIRLPRAEAN